MDFGKLVTLRVLIKESSSESGVVEVRILEVSPSGEFVKLSRPKGGNPWRKSAEIEVIEALDKALS